ncbi:JAB domain-containing protein [Holzapfeliella sp. He02]|uniref:JAB domain-containing protein n=1 Tax=Holzapfeliella saturejae TaxID=3082953 RepID=A0ABU8SFZ8_9LACO
MFKNKIQVIKASDKELLIKFMSHFTKQTTVTDLHQYVTSLSLTDNCNQEQDIFEEIVNRFKQLRLKKLTKYTSNQLMGEHLKSLLVNFNQEVLLLVCLDVKNHIISEQIVFKGTLTHTVVHPREIFRLAILNQSAKIILAHNHPSEDLEPSRADISFSKQMVAAGKLMGIECLDHFIVSKNDFMSLKSYDFI